MVSIHLILLFIRFGKVPVIVTQMFQYISCYSLSGSIGELSVVNRLFQYISCYSLSIKTMVSVGIRKVSIHLMLLFIEDELSKIADSVRFNTSHVTLYQFQKMCRIKSKSCFNTSHVTLYLKSPVRDLLSRYRFNTSHVTLYRIMIN